MSRIRSASRVLFLTVLILSASAVAGSYVEATSGPARDTGTPANGGVGGASTSANGTDGERTSRRTERPAGTVEIDVESRFRAARNGTVPSENWSAQRVQRAAGARGLTVVATQGFYVSDERAEIAAFTPDGRLVYYNDSYRVYFDVDPVPGERYTVEYVASKHLPAEQCERFESDRCTRNVVARVNLTTGDHEVVYAERTPRIYSARWHDVDRVNETRLVVADIVTDSVYAVDTRDGSVAWRWNASEAYDRDQGGQEGDWTHVNDVELLADGRVMVSLRNMDSVVFLEASDGEYVMDENWTLGEDDDHDTLYEQHNPDYVPERMGGPSVLVADSENTRIVEYRRSGDRWVRAWSWRDVRLQWPRDADRLPNGNTLIVDSHGDRVAEISPDGTVAWSADVGMPYDVERIGTGDESSGGMAAHLRNDPEMVPLSTGGETATDTATTVNASGGPATGAGLTPVDRVWLGLKQATPSLVANGLLYVSPSWVRFSDLAFAALWLLTLLGWAGTEFYWSRYTVRGVVSRGVGAVRQFGAGVRSPRS